MKKNLAFVCNLIFYIFLATQSFNYYALGDFFSRDSCYRASNVTELETKIP